MQAALCLITVLATVTTLQPRLWKPQLRRLGLLVLLVYVTTVLGTGTSCLQYQHDLCT